MTKRPSVVGLLGAFLMFGLPVSAALAAPATEPATPLVPPKSHFFKGKLIGVELFTDTRTKRDDRVPVWAQFLIEQPYGSPVLPGVPGDASGLVRLRLQILPDVPLELARSTGPTSFPELLRGLGLRPGDSYLVRADVGDTALQTFVTVIPYTEEAEKHFLRDNKQLIEFTTEYLKDAKRRARQGLIDALRQQIAQQRGLLQDNANQYPPAERAEMEKNIADSEQKLKDLLATPDDVYPPPSWR